MEVLCPGVSQMLLFSWTDIKDLALFCHFKGNDKIQKEDGISGRSGMKPRTADFRG